MAADPMRSKALAILREARCTVLRVLVDDAWRPVVVLARVRSSRGRQFYRVQLSREGWSCTCDAGRHDDPCPHIIAVSLVTTQAAA